VNWETVRILAVDDVPETLRQFKDLFNQLNIKCDTAADGYEACRLIEENGGYDIYFIDWRMPGIDGIELTKRIRSLNKDRQSVVVMITAADWEQIRENALRSGVNKCILKPLFSSSIVDCINECLGINVVDVDNDTIAGRFEGKKLLLVEDIEINREIIIALLENSGFESDCAENGKDALEMIETAPGKYDIVLMDIQMPKMNGYEATRRIRALPSLHGVKLPIIAMTANVFKNDIEECVAAGMDSHIGKPLDIDKLFEVLRKYIN
jgi:CheY-like chemotaxis protein